MTLIEEIDNLIRPIVEGAGYKLVKVELGFQNRTQLLTVTINKEGSVSVEDCATVSRLIDPILDEKDLIRRKYFLVVSSPGIK